MECPFTEFTLREFKLLQRRRRIKRKLKAEEFVTQNLEPLKFEKLMSVLDWIPITVSCLSSCKSSL